jgi:hypothetical protein
MKTLGIFFCLGLAGMALTGCNHSDPSANASTKTAAAAEAGPKKPADSANENTWGNYLAEQGKIHGKDVGMRPYIYVVPRGDTAAAEARRKNEADSIVTGVGNIIVPGSLLIIGGPDAGSTQAFTQGIAKDIKPGALKDVTLLIVSDEAQKDALAKALDPTGARLRVVSM